MSDYVFKFSVICSGPVAKIKLILNHLIKSMQVNYEECSWMESSLRPMETLGQIEVLMSSDARESNSCETILWAH